MKKIIFLISFFITAQFAFSQSEKSKIKTLEIKTEIFCDHCQKCESCGLRLYNNITENKGVKSVKINDKNNTISIKYNSKKIRAEELEQAVSMSGFKAKDLEANENAYEKLDNCCKKK